MKGLHPKLRIGSMLLSDLSWSKTYSPTKKTNANFPIATATLRPRGTHLRIAFLCDQSNLPPWERDRKGE
jgi:hypothetical protein